MTDLKIATAQFETTSGDKSANLSTIARLTASAATQGAQVIVFHECSISGYTFARDLTRAQLLAIAEPIPAGPSTQSLIQIAREHNITILAGLFESSSSDDENDTKIYNTYVCISPQQGHIASHRKLHPFISLHLSPGTSYTVFPLHNFKAGILTCYDNNVLENVRATALLGAEIIFMPHVTMCTPSTRPGAGFVSPELWLNREKDPTSLREEFDGLKGRKWLMKWLPARAYDNAVYVVFSNPIGMEGDQVKNGCSMILDPFGDVLAECRVLGEDVVVARCGREKLELAGGWRYRMARRVGLYCDILGAEHETLQKVSWLGGGGKEEEE
jgi:predicted amidohydrolase